MLIELTTMRENTRLQQSAHRGVNQDKYSVRKFETTFCLVKLSLVMNNLILHPTPISYKFEIVKKGNDI